MVDPEQSTASSIDVPILAMAPPKEKESMLQETTSVGSTNTSLEENRSSPASISQFLGTSSPSMLQDSPADVPILAMAPPKEKDMLQETTSVGSTNTSLEENGSSTASISECLATSSQSILQASQTDVPVLAPKEKEKMLQVTTSGGSTNISLEGNGSPPAFISECLATSSQSILQASQTDVPVLAPKEKEKMLQVTTSGGSTNILLEENGSPPTSTFECLATPTPSMLQASPADVPILATAPPKEKENILPVTSGNSTNFTLEENGLPPSISISEFFVTPPTSLLSLITSEVSVLATPTATLSSKKKKDKPLPTVFGVSQRPKRDLGPSKRKFQSEALITEESSEKKKKSDCNAAKCKEVIFLNLLHVFSFLRLYN